MTSKRKRGEEGMGEGEIVWQTPANAPQRCDYIFHNGRRHVRPYYFEFIAHVKNRWAGKSIVDLFTEEFKGRPYEYYIDAVKCGRIQVDGEMVPTSYIVKTSQKISHFLHRHEPPVMALEVKILKEEADVLTVYKPASVPVHPCGQYRKNTVVGILQAEHGLAPLFPIHRLDRLVSGLLIIARNASKADLFRQQIESGLVKKQYIARVVGVFPEEEQVVDVHINYNAREGRSTTEMVDSCKDTMAKGKAAQTKFTCIGSDGVHSIVLCEPVTGRTHQIRVHLQYTGYPIANDALYLTKVASGRSVEKTTADRAAAISACSTAHDIEEDCVSARKENSSEDFSIDPMCTNCPNLAPKGYDGEEEGLWLHCVRYSGPGWIYECPYPEWASLK
ncbi:RNA pseudouridine synthase 7-like isoform X1 [Cucurbita moschata]|uniref:Pseudouridine synthase n=1 Tax=Cucurbita moschata TaxID=3662 RepID=A0A6J1F2L9_CUCMO|nr:RNA pseudouridine synthase 7-like isoform X1 [Cucurbita moschata]